MFSVVSCVFVCFSVFLWAMLGAPRPTKTYWIACITYIELIVVIKYIFQFKISALSDESNKSLQNAMLMIGIQKSNYFALFDLFVLLVIFLHRLILKRFGLWRDYSEDDELLLVNKSDVRKSLVNSSVTVRRDATASNNNSENVNQTETSNDDDDDGDGDGDGDDEDESLRKLAIQNAKTSATSAGGGGGGGGVGVDDESTRSLHSSAEFTARLTIVSEKSGREIVQVASSQSLLELKALAQQAACGDSAPGGDGDEDTHSSFLEWSVQLQPINVVFTYI